MSKITPVSSLDTILERIKSTSVVKKDIEIAFVLGVSKANVSAWKRRGTIPFENLYAYSISNEVSFDWLMRGIGSPEGQKKHTVYQVKEDGKSYEIDSEFISIPFYEVDISAGNGNNPIDEEEFKPLMFRREFFDKLGLKHDDLIGGKVPGDSMQPLIPAGSGILIDTADKKMTDGKIYVFNADGNLLVKKIIVSFDGFIAHSLNEEYKDIEISKEKVDSLIIVGRARLALPYIKL